MWLMPWESYWVLSPSRQVGPAGGGYIPITAVAAYCEMIEEDDVEQRLWLARIVKEMDEVYLSFIGERNATISGTGTQS